MRRRTMLTGSAALLASGLTQPSAAQAPAAQAPNESLLLRIKMATTGAPDIKKFEEMYTRWLGFSVVERGKISAALARSWGAPKTAGRPFVTLAAPGTPDVYYRGVEVDAVPGYKAMTTWGWNAFEILVEHPDPVYDKLKDSPFRHVGGPAFIMGGQSTAKAVQFAGPGEELFYFTAETDPAKAANMVKAKSLIDRPFIMVLAGPDAGELVQHYMKLFNAPGNMPREVPIKIIATAQGLPLDHKFPLGGVRAREPRNSIEIDTYPPSAKQRPRAAGQLPPGCAIASFSVADLDAIKAKYITKPAKLYGNARAATLIGPAGELMELIEEKRG